MSNVLIGIIGVILFIGLALAGALILGDDFTSSTNDSKAAALVQQIQQATNAANMYALKTGRQVNPGLVSESALMGRFLKTAPINPVADGGPAYLYDRAGSYTSTAPATTVILTMKNVPGDQPICESIQRETGQIDGSAAFDGTSHTIADIPALKSPIGCIFAGANRRYYIYGRI